MADFDNGIPPEGTDIQDDHVGNVAFDSAAENTEDAPHTGSIAFESAEEDTGATPHAGSVALETEESGDMPFTLQVLCDEEWIVDSFPEWVWPDILSGEGNGTIDIVVYRNTGHERTGKIVVKTADGMAKAEHTITQQAGGTVYIADINVTLAANPAVTSGLLQLENVRVNRNDSEIIDEIGPFAISTGQSVRQAISYSSLEDKPDAITCTVWLANVAPLPANREVSILSAGVLLGVMTTDANGIGSMEMVIPIVNTGLDNYTMALEVDISPAHTLTYDPNGGTLSGGTAGGNYYAGAAITLPTSAVKSGYTFAGFVSGAFPGVTYRLGDTFVMPASNLTVTAIWTAV